MSREYEYRVIVAEGDKKTAGSVRVRELDAKDRSRRSLRALGICWSISLFSVILPIAHFFLVPGFFLAGPIVAYFIYQQDRLLLSGNAFCPGCSQEFMVQPGKLKWPYNDVCTHCRTQVRLTQVT